MEIGKRLKEFRKKKKIKMPAIAAATGISKENLYKTAKKEGKATNLRKYYIF